MKKIISTALVLAISIASAANVAAAPLMLAYDGQAHQYSGKAYNMKVNGEFVQTDMPAVIINDRALVPARAVFEKMGAVVNWDGANQKVLVSLNNTNVELKINDKNALVNSKSVELDVPAKIINERTMLPARFVSEQLNMKVGWLPDENLITIDKSNFKGITHTSRGEEEVVSISLDYYKNYSVFRLDEPGNERIVIDIPNISASEDLQNLEINSGLLKTVRYRLNEENKLRVVLDTVGQLVYSIEEKDGQLNVVLNGQGGRGGDVRNPTPTPVPTQAPVPTPIPTPPAIPMPTPTPIQPQQPLFGTSKITYSTSGGQDEILIPIDGDKDYKDVRATDPERIVIDIANQVAPKNEQKINVGSSRLKAIRYAQFEGSTARIVLDVSGYPDYQIEKRGNFLVVKVKDSTYGNISYHSNGDRVYFSLKWTQLTQSEDEVQKLYTGSYDSTGKKYTITFRGYRQEFKIGNLKIKDSYIDSVDIQGNDATGDTILTFNAKDKFVYEIITRYDAGGNIMDTAVTLLKPASKTDKLVVIDPGHGGYETGAAANGMYEKHLNLDIANRLNALLKSKGVKTYIIREDDSYIGLYERAYIANDLKASLFVSIHNNAWNATANGTETLYNTSDPNAVQINSIKFAQIVQPYLVNTLGTFDRKIVERPRLVVLRKTLMPAILTEIAFMDNYEDASRLKTSDFKQKAAQALCDGILKALGEIK